MGDKVALYYTAGQVGGLDVCITIVLLASIHVLGHSRGLTGWKQFGVTVISKNWSNVRILTSTACHICKGLVA